MRTSTLFMVMIFAFFLLVLIKLFNVSYPVQVTNTNKSSEFSITGEGKVEVVPDTAYVDLGITVTNAASVEQAQKTIDQTNNQIIAAMQKLNIPKTNIKTSNYSIYPNTLYDGSENPRIAGYNGNVTITIKIKGTELTSQVIQEATKAGANQVQGTRFEVANPSAYREKARAEAIANAKEQAQKLAKELGIPLGKIVNIVEYSPSNTIPPMYDMKAANSLGGGGGPMIEAGSQTITSVVTLYFEKK